jgi:hypothetical protein
MLALVSDPSPSPSPSPAVPSSLDSPLEKLEPPSGPSSLFEQPAATRLEDKQTNTTKRERPGFNAGFLSVDIRAS